MQIAFILTDPQENKLKIHTDYLAQYILLYEHLSITWRHLPGLLKVLFQWNLEHFSFLFLLDGLLPLLEAAARGHALPDGLEC
jgi:hypothetical protein